jgi:hypothetical protein
LLVITETPSKKYCTENVFSSKFLSKQKKALSKKWIFFVPENYHEYRVEALVAARVTG